MTWWMKFNQLLTARRVGYAWIAGIILWIAWILSCLLGTGNMDLAGHVVGTDYITIYASGVALRQGQSANLYNFEYQSQLEQTIAGPGLTTFNAFITPPFLAWLFVPFSAIPYIWSFIVWSLLSLLFLWISLKLLSSEQPLKTFLFSLTWFPIFAAISFGENSLLSLVLLCLAYWLWRKEKRLLAGLACSLLLYKPQLVLGIGLLWLLEWRSSWKSLLGLLIGGASLAGLCFWLLPGASLGYINLARTILPNLIYGKEFPLWHMHSLRGFWLLLFPGKAWLSEGLSLLLSVIGLLVFIKLWRNHRKKPDLLFSAATCFTIWVTPHAMIYDWSILLIPAVLLWQGLPELRNLWKPMFALIWIATFISGPLTSTQLKYIPIALQVSVPVFFIVLYTIYKTLSHPSPAESPIHDEG